MKKILVVSNMYPSEKFPSYGVFVKRFCDQLDEICVPYELCVMNKGSNFLDKVWKYFVFYFETFFKCLFCEYETVYVHYASYSTPSVLLARKFRNFKFIVNAHGTDVIFQNKNQEKMGRYTEQAMRLADKIVVPSEYFKKVVQERFKLNHENIKVYPSAGVDLKLFYPAKTSKEIEFMVEKFGLNPRKIHIGFVGRLTKAKGWRTFLEAIDILASKRNDIEIIIVGSGKEESTIHQLVNKRKLNHIVKFFPLLNQEDLACIYRLLDIMAFPSENESLGLVGLEAMASGAVVIASDYAAPKYYIDNGINGLKFKLKDHKELAEKMEIVLNNRELRGKLQTAGIKKANEYSASKAVNILSEILK